MTAAAVVPVRRISVPLETERGTFAMRLVILTESFLFISLFASYFMLENNKERWRIEELPKLNFAIPMLAVLIVSSLVLHWGELQVKKQRYVAGRIALALTILIGLAFLTLQALEYRAHWEHLTPYTDSYGSIFYTITTFHAAHLIAGLLILAYVLVLPRYAPALESPYRPFHVAGLHMSPSPMIRLIRLPKFLLSCFALLLALPAFSQSKPDCSSLPDHTKLRSVLQSVVKEGATGNSGLGNQEWAVTVNRDGTVCAVVFSGNDRGQQWPGSRAIAAEKANTANALSSSDYALSTANVFAASQPGQSLYSLTTSAPPNAQAVFGPAPSFGTPDDPMVGKPIGGVIVFGGGLPLYSAKGKIVGGLGLSGDTSCADHIMAWKVRHQLQLDAVPMGPSPDHNDNMILDWSNNNSPSGFGHPTCKGGNPPGDIIKELSKKYPTGPKGH
jgi:heme/copper-type cytochrome/quinol oxidase subunit 3/uncharacterized protein GlcG (DUF336 family)